MCGITLAYLIGAVSPNMDVANAALPAYVTILLFFCGLLVLDNKMPNYWAWQHYLTFIRFSWRAVMVDHFRGLGDPPLFANGLTTLQFYSLDVSARTPVPLCLDHIELECSQAIFSLPPPPPSHAPCSLVHIPPA